MWIISNKISNFKEAQPNRDKIDQRCNARSEAGYCRLDDRKYFYDSIRKECVPKVLGDCNGDEDLFDTEMECKNACLKHVWENFIVKALQVERSFSNPMWIRLYLVSNFLIFNWIKVFILPNLLLSIKHCIHGMTFSRLRVSKTVVGSSQMVRLEIPVTISST